MGASLGGANKNNAKGEKNGRKKRFLWGIAAVALVFAVGVVACDNETMPEIAKKKPAEEGPGPRAAETRTYRAAGMYVNDAETPESETSSLDEAFTWIRANAEDDGSYTIVLGEDTTVDGNRHTGVHAAFLLDSAALNWTTGVSITLIGLGGERTIQLQALTQGYGQIFFLEKGRLILGNNITLKGLMSNDAPLVHIDFNSYGVENPVFAEFKMLDGSKITGNKSTVGAVYIARWATFIMDGGEISNNEGGPGVRIGTGGTFTMSGGKIHGNRAYSNYGTYGGGVYALNNSTFTMSGGEIYGNQVVTRSSNPDGYVYGGGVAVETANGQAEPLMFKKTGGIIYGYDPADPDNPKSNKVIRNGVVQTDKGSAVVHTLYLSTVIQNRREATSFADDNIDSTKSGPDGGWL